jgi:hypothetical protein
MYGFFFERLSVHQTTGVWPIVWVFFNDLPLKYTGEDLVKGEVIRLSLFIGVVGDSNAIVSNGLDDASYVHCLLAFR